MVKFLSKKGKKSPDRSKNDTSKKKSPTAGEMKSTATNFCFGSTTAETKDEEDFNPFDGGVAYDKNGNEPMFFMSKRNDIASDPTASLMDGIILPSPQNNVHVTTHTTSKYKGRKTVGSEKSKGGLLRLKKSIRKLRKNDKNENDERKWRCGALRLVDDAGYTSVSSKSKPIDAATRDAWLVDDDVFKGSWPKKEKDVNVPNKDAFSPRDSQKSNDEEEPDVLDLFGGDPFGSDFEGSDKNQIVQVKLDAVVQWSPVNDNVDVETPAFNTNTSSDDGRDNSSGKEEDCAIPQISSTSEDIKVFTFDIDEQEDSESDTKNRDIGSPGENDPVENSSEHEQNSETSENHQNQSIADTPNASKNSSMLTLISLAQSSGISELHDEDDQNVYGRTYADDGDDDEIHRESLSRPIEISVPSSIGNIQKTIAKVKEDEKKIVSPDGKKDGSPFLVDLSIIPMNEDNMLDNDVTIDSTSSDAAAKNADVVSSRHNSSNVRKYPTDPTRKSNSRSVQNRENSDAIMSSLPTKYEESIDNKENLTNHYNSNIAVVDEILVETSKNGVSDHYDTNTHDTLLDLRLYEEPNEHHNQTYNDRVNENYVRSPKFGNSRINSYQNHNISSPMSNNNTMRISPTEMTDPRNFKRNEQYISGSTFFWRSHPNAGKNVQALTGKIREQLQPRQPSPRVDYLERNMSSHTPTSSNAVTFTDSDLSDHRIDQIDQSIVRNALITSSNLDERKVETYRKKFQHPSVSSRSNTSPNNHTLQNSEASAAVIHDRKVFSATHPKHSPDEPQQKSSNNLMSHIEKHKPLPHQNCASSIGETSSVKQRIAVFESGGL